MLKADLHIHSNVSDGSDTIADIVMKAADLSLDAIAITDHDTLTHSKQIAALQETTLLGVRVIAGIEISARDGKGRGDAHILGYGIENIDMVTDFTLPTLQTRHENALKQIEILQKHGYHFDMSELLKADGQYIYKQHIMHHLWITGQVSSMFGDSYAKFFAKDGLCPMSIAYVDACEAVKVITEAGGKAVLAHSGYNQNFYIIDELVDCGLVGLEYNHPDHEAKDRAILAEFAQKHGLFLTGGSDYHGSFEPQDFALGACLSEKSGVLALC